MEFISPKLRHKFSCRIQQKGSYSIRHQRLAHRMVSNRFFYQKLESQDHYICVYLRQSLTQDHLSKITSSVLTWQTGHFASKTRDPRFKSSHRQTLYTYKLSTVLKKTKIKKNRPGIAHFLKNTSSVIASASDKNGAHSDQSGLFLKDLGYNSIYKSSLNIRQLFGLL